MQVRKNSEIYFYVSYLQNIRKCKYFQKNQQPIVLILRDLLFLLNKNIK